MRRLLHRVASGAAVLALLAGLAPRATAQPSRTLVATPAELRAAVSAAQPGDVIAMADGTWTDLAIVFRADGVEGDSIRLEAETPGGVLLEGASSLRIAGDYLVVDGLRFEGGRTTGSHLVEFRDGSRVANHSRLTNSTILDVVPSSPSQNTKWVSLYGTHNRVDHNAIQGKTNLGTTLVVWLESGSRHEPTYHRIDRNYFGPRPPLGQNGGETIRIGTSTTSMQDAFVTVERNLFDRCNGESEIISNKSGQNVFRGNTFLRSKGALTLRHGNGARVEGNVFLGKRVEDSGGVRVIGEDHVIVNNYFDLLGGTGFESAIAIMNGVPNSPLNRYFQVRNVVIAHNTFIRVERPLTLGAGADAERTLPPDGVAFVNNVIFSGGSSIVRQEAEPTNMTWDGTLYWGGSLGIDAPPGLTEVNPMIQPADGELWRPAEGSPVVDAAVAVPGLDLSLDVDGQPRDSQPDVGADERSDAPVVLRPLTAEDVGPTWSIATTAETGPARPAAVTLGSPVPNPARARASVVLTTLAPGPVEVAVYDTLGRRAATVPSRETLAGPRRLDLDLRGLAPGRYQIVARAATGVARAALVIVSH